MHFLYFEVDVFEPNVGQLVWTLIFGLFNFFFELNPFFRLMNSLRRQYLFNVVC